MSDSSINLNVSPVASVSGAEEVVAFLDGIPLAIPVSLLLSAGGVTLEQVRDDLASVLVEGTNVTITVDDTANTITISAAGGAGTTNLTYTPATRLLESSTGADVTLPLVVASGDAGLMTGADKTILNNLAAATFQLLDSDLTSIAALSTTVFGRGLLTLANAAGLVSAAGLDADLATFVVPASTTISAFGATLIDDASGPAAIGTLGLDADLLSFSLPSSTTISAFGASVVDDADAVTARATLGIIKRETYSYEGVCVVGTGIKRLYFARAATIVNVVASVDVAGTGTGNIVVDLMRNGVTMFTGGTGRPTIAPAAFSDISNTPAVTAVTAGDYLTVDIVSITGTLPGEGLTVAVEYRDA